MEGGASRGCTLGFEPCCLATSDSPPLSCGRRSDSCRWWSTLPTSPSCTARRGPPEGTGGAALAEPGGLSAALAAVVERARSEGLTLDAEIDPAITTMHSIQRLAVLRVVQEGLTNVIKHAGAHARATLRVRATADEVHVAVRDDGGGRRGHDSRPDPGFGLVGMRERVELLGGSVRAGTQSPGWELAVVIPNGTPEEGR